MGVTEDLQTVLALLADSLTFDDNTFLETIDAVHERIHEGGTWVAGSLVEHGSEISNDGTAQWGLTAGSKDMHATMLFATGGNSDFRMYEGGTISAGSTATNFNLHRGSTATSDAELLIGPTVSADGTELPPIFVPGGGGPFSNGAAYRAGAEIILKAGEVYVFRAVNRSGGSIQMSFTLEWYEE
jgi:hypothetical protein